MQYQTHWGFEFLFKVTGKISAAFMFCGSELVDNPKKNWDHITDLCGLASHESTERIGYEDE
jgi:hypothetical protein